MKKEYDNCIRFDSSINPCPYRDNKDLTAVRNLGTQGLPIDTFLGQEFERANAVCLTCDYFDAGKTK
jgi:hypothetical protein